VTGNQGHLAIGGDVVLLDQPLAVHLPEKSALVGGWKR
jgi:hypothetical protein